MRIDSGSPQPAPERPAFASRDGAAPDFSQLLQAFTRPADPPVRSGPNSMPHAEIQQQHREAHIALKTTHAEIREQHAEISETRREGYLRGLETQQEHMEDLVENWKDRSPHRADGESKSEAHDDVHAEIAEILDGGDDGGDLISDMEVLPLDPEHQQDQSGKGASAQRQLGSEEDDLARSAGERELSYQEIQDLVETTLNAGQNMPPRVRHLLQELLGSLLDGQRWLLDQHRLIGLDQDEWNLIRGMFPAHFYSGLLRQHLKSPLPLYDLLQDLFEQIPCPARQDLLALWPELSEQLLLRNWVLDQPLPAQPDELVQLLELWQHQGSLPPGAIGRTLQLSLAYRHHPEKMQALYLVAGDLLHGRPLGAEACSLLAQCISERCFPRELSDTAQIQHLIEQLLQGNEPSESDLMLLLSGCSQGVLSYLPYGHMPASLRELQDYVRRDLLGREELVPNLLKEDGGGPILA